MTITPDLREIEEKAKAADAEIAQLKKLAKALSDALLTLRPMGGSEMFKRGALDDVYYADPDYCRALIAMDRTDLHETRKNEVLLQRRIRELEGALKWIRERADSGGRRLETAADACDEIERRAATAYKGEGDGNVAAD